MHRLFVEILGVRVDLVDYETIINLIKKSISQHSLGRYICPCPVHPIIVAQRDRELNHALNDSWLTVPDGMPVVWAAKMLGGPAIDRVYGPNLMLQACQMAEMFGFSVFLYGGKPQTLEKLKRNLLKRFPNLSFAGAYSPPFRALSPKEEKTIVTMINKASPHILFVALGAPKQEKWMAKHCRKVNVKVMVGVGAAFDFLSGEKKQAPKWMQTRGLEWLFRLLSEPTRLWARYAVYNPLFVALFLGQLIRAKLCILVGKDQCGK